MFNGIMHNRKEGSAINPLFGNISYILSSNSLAYDADMQEGELNAKKETTI